MSSFKAKTKLEKAALMLVVENTVERGSDVGSNMHAKLLALRSQFKQLDLDGSGCVNAKELETAIKNVCSSSANPELQFDDAAISSMIKEIDYVGNNMINYSEFLLATLSFNDQLTDEML